MQDPIPVPPCGAQCVRPRFGGFIAPTASLGTEALECTLSASEAADYLDKVVAAIRERRLYGFMLQEAAESRVSAGEWIEKTTEEAIAEARAHEKRHDGCSE